MYRDSGFLRKSGVLHPLSLPALSGAAARSCSGACADGAPVASVVGFDADVAGAVGALVPPGPVRCTEAGWGFFYYF
jgi:hypothetical protein